MQSTNSALVGKLRFVAEHSEDEFSGLYGRNDISEERVVRGPDSTSGDCSTARIGPT
jgi:hypothetical protein